MFTALRIFVREPERKSPLGRPRHRWDEKIKMDLRELGWGGMEGSCGYSNEVSGSIKYWEAVE
jgi:hypothetical protein